MRAMWIFVDDLEHGMEHGRHYNIEKKTLKNGKISVIVDETKRKLIFENTADFACHFRVC